ncbi:MAG TPA: hypothetical protein PKG93_00275 [Bacilli bacterium]|nr:hypothetical protein [Bacilli bacterium]HPZ24029.1 hypothetical protein [Bacilli bacterium]
MKGVIYMTGRSASGVNSSFITTMDFCKLFQYGKNFKYFQDIDEEKLKHIYKEIDLFKGHLDTCLSPFMRSNSLIYKETLKRVSLYRESLDTFDEKILFLILMCDPNLVILHSKKRIISVTKDDLVTAEDPEKEALKLCGEKDAWAHECIEKLGFFEQKLAPYEKAYMKKFCNHLEKNVAADYTYKLMEGIPLNKNYNLKSDDIINMQLLVNSFKGDIPNDYKTMLYNLLYQNDIIPVKTKKDIMLFLVLALDPNYSLISIYEEECKIEDIMRRAKVELGFFDPHFIMIEKQIVYALNNTNKDGSKIVDDAWSRK